MHTTTTGKLYSRSFAHGAVLLLAAVAIGTSGCIDSSGEPKQIRIGTRPDSNLYTSAQAAAPDLHRGPVAVVAYEEPVTSFSPTLIEPQRLWSEQEMA